MRELVFIPSLEINDLQRKVFEYIDWWVHKQKTPVPLKQIIVAMSKEGVKDFTTELTINTLMRKGYIRKAITVGSNRTFFVQLRGL